jgi:carbonic anhydrase
MEGLIDSIEKGILEFKKSSSVKSFSKGDLKQHPKITLLTCSDSRIPTNIFGETFDRIFSVENIGNQVKVSEGSVLYGILHLHTPVVIVAGHTDCGAIKAAQSDFSKEEDGIKRELSILKNSLDDISSGIKFGDKPEIKFTQLAEKNVDYQISYLLENPEVIKLVKEEKLDIFGMIVDLHNVYKNGFGEVCLINVNGKTDIEKIRKSKRAGILAKRVNRSP